MIKKKNLNLYLLGATAENEIWGPRQIIAAATEKQAISMAEWDYSDETVFCKKIDKISTTGSPRVIFRHWGG